MWTLTLDPELFGWDHAEAYRYCSKNRVVSRLVRELNRRGHLLSGDYFCAVEYQQNGMVHFHVLLNARYVPFGDVCEIWNRFRPKDADEVEGDRPGFGAVRFSAPKFASMEHAANYATKYVIKTPEEGWPDWVLQQRNLARYSISKGLWSAVETKKSGSVDVVHAVPEWELMNKDPILSQWVADGRVEVAPWVLKQTSVMAAREMIAESDPEWWDMYCAGQEELRQKALREEKPEQEPVRTIGERVASCRETACVVKVTAWVDASGEIHKSAVWLEGLAVPYGEVLERLGVEQTQEVKYGCRVRPSEIEQLLGKHSMGTSTATTEAEDRSVESDTVDNQAEHREAWGAFEQWRDVNSDQDAWEIGKND